MSVLAFMLRRVWIVIPTLQKHDVNDARGLLHSGRPPAAMLQRQNSCQLLSHVQPMLP